jgi:hypothetical protein
MTRDELIDAMSADAGITRGGEPMKALSLHQPWASFIAIGIKPFETRSWPPPRWMINKRLAIQASKKPVGANVEWAQEHGIVDIPLGAVVCTAALIGAYHCGAPIAQGLLRITDYYGLAPSVERGLYLATDHFGNYAEGRWAWHLTDIERFDPPIPARGMQGIWEWANG